MFGDQTRLFIPKVSNLYLLEDEDALELSIEALDHAYVMKDYDPEDLCLDAVIVYPSFSVATLLLVTIAGVLFFRERLRRLQWLAVALILVALALLNM